MYSSYGRARERLPHSTTAAPCALSGKCVRQRPVEAPMTAMASLNASPSRPPFVPL